MLKSLEFGLPSPVPLIQVSQVISLLFSSSVMALVSAADEPGSSGPVAQQVIIQNSNKLLQQRSEAAATHIVTSQELQQYADTSVLAVLQRQAGVTTNNGQISLRGLPANYTQILLNGEPAPPGFSLESLNPALLERIEIVTGGRADQSAQAIAGSVNLIFKANAAGLPEQAQFQLQRGKTQQNLTLANDMNGKWAGLEYGLRLQLQDFHYAGSEHSSEQRFDMQQEAAQLSRQIQEQGDSRSRRWSVLARLQSKGSSGEQWQVLGTLERGQTQAQGTSQETMLAGGANDYPHNSFQSEVWQLQGRIEGQWKRRLNDELRMQHKLAYWYSDRDIDYQFHGQSGDDVTRFQRQVISNANENKWQQSTQFNWNFHTQHSLALGWSLAQTQRQEQRLQLDNYRSVQQNGTNTRPEERLNERYQAKIDQLAFYLQDEWDIREDWRSYLGLRWESLSTAVDSQASLQQEGLLKNRVAVWSPVLSLLWRNPQAIAKKQTQQWRLALGRSYKAPEPRQIIPRRYTLNNGNNPANADYAGNPKLLPELAWNADLGYEYSWGEGTWLGVNGYAKRIQNVVLDDLVQYQQRWLIHPGNFGVATIQGLELDLRLPLSIPIFKGSWSMRFHTAYHHSRLHYADWDNARLPGQLPYSWSYLLDYQHGAMQASLNWQVQAGGKSQANALSSNAQSQSNKLELAWHYRLHPQLRLSLMHSRSLRGDGVQSTSYQDRHTRWQRSRLNQDEGLSRLQLEFSF